MSQLKKQPKIHILESLEFVCQEFSINNQRRIFIHYVSLPYFIITRLGNLQKANKPSFILWKTLPYQHRIPTRFYIIYFIFLRKVVVTQKTFFFEVKICWKLFDYPFSRPVPNSRSFVLSPGLHRNELLPGEIADDMDKERKYLQLTTADYLYKVNDIKTKKGVNLVQNLIEYYKAQCK